MMERELEPELMDTEQDAMLYDAMDHAHVNSLFVTDLLAEGEFGDDVVDLGTGTALIPIELCRHHQTCRVMASDAAVSMLEIARYNVAASGYENRIQLHFGDAKQLGFVDDMFDLVMSNSLVHHIANPQTVIAEMVRIARSGARIFVRDLCRPASMHEIESLVAMYAERETAEAQQLFRQSLAAALTCEEMTEIVQCLGQDPTCVKMSSDRHWTWATRKE